MIWNDDFIFADQKLEIRTLVLVLMEAAERYLSSGSSLFLILSNTLAEMMHSVL